MRTSYEAGERVRFTNESGKMRRFGGRTFQPGAAIEITLERDFDDNDGIGEGGPWGWGGYRSSFLFKLAGRKWSNVHFRPDDY